MPSQMMCLERRVQLRMNDMVRLRTVCPMCEDRGTGDLCSRHANEVRLKTTCPRCEKGGTGTLCAGHTHAIETGRRYGSARVARHVEEERLSTVCPQCEIGGWGPQCRVHVLIAASVERRKALAHTPGQRPPAAEGAATQAPQRMNALARAPDERPPAAEGAATRVPSLSRTRSRTNAQLVSVVSCSGTWHSSHRTRMDISRTGSS